MPVMEKVCFVLWRHRDADVDALDKWVTAELVPALDAADGVRAGQVLVEATEGASVRVGARADGALLAGLVATWLDVYQDRDAIDAALATGLLHDVHAYLVTESVPHDDASVPRPVGERAPGLTMTTIFDKKPGVDDAEFYRVWHEMHRRTTLELHPVYVYYRNEVVRALTPGAPALRGIVYEPTRTVEDMLDPHTFYGALGDDTALKANIDRVVSETTAFIDFTTIEVAPMHSYELPRR
jgi:hypothetical protein